MVEVKKGEPIFNRPERPPRPKSLRELYQIIVRTCPATNHSEEKFVGSVITQLERDPIRNSSLKSEVTDKNLDIELPKSWPLNDFWYAAYKYLRSIGVQETEINKLEIIVIDGFI